jgi:hypothetical protein
MFVSIALCSTCLHGTIQVKCKKEHPRPWLDCQCKDTALSPYQADLAHVNLENSSIVRLGDEILYNLQERRNA